MIDKEIKKLIKAQLFVEDRTVNNYFQAMGLCVKHNIKESDLPKIYQTKIKSFRLQFDDILLAKDEMPYGDHQGEKLISLDMMHLISIINNGVLGKADAVKAKSRFFWDKVHKAVYSRRTELVMALATKISKPFKRTKAGYIDETYYFKISQRK